MIRFVRWIQFSQIYPKLTITRLLQCSSIYANDMMKENCVMKFNETDYFAIQTRTVNWLEKVAKNHRSFSSHWWRFFSKPDQVWPARVAFESFFNCFRNERFAFFNRSGKHRVRTKTWRTIAMRKGCCGGRGWLASANHMLFTFVMARAPVVVDYKIRNSRYN